MGLERIKEEILQKAANIEKQILSEAALNVKDIVRSISEETRHIENEASQKLASDVKALESKEISIVNMEIQKMLFQAKKEILEDVFSDAFNNIRNMPRKDRTNLLARLFDKASKEIEVYITYANEEDKSMINRGIVKPLKTEGGIICENEDGTIRVDYTFTAIFNEVKEKTMKEASKIMFG